MNGFDQNTAPIDNLAQTLERAAALDPSRAAMHFPVGTTSDGRVQYQSLSFGELDAEVKHLAAGLRETGVGIGIRTVVMVKPSPQFFVLMFALFRIGAIPVLIDPGINRRALKQCLAEAEPQVFIGISIAHLARVILGWARSARTLVTVGRRWLWGGHTYAQVLARGRAAHARDARAGECARTDPHALAAILFTSGSTGIPKGVEYTQANFLAQIEMLRERFGFQPGEVDLPTFPPFALFDPALGMTAVIPDMDFTRPAQADPNKLLQAIEQFKVTTMFGSPALMDAFSQHLHAHQMQLAGVRRVCSAGAPVRPDVVARMLACLREGAEFFTPYGATECLPLAVIEGQAILTQARARTERGDGICVGQVLDQNTVRIIAITDEPIASMNDARVLPPGEIGEITVRGPSTTRAYHRRESATRLAKIRDRDGAIVHRMGDVGYFDADGLLWYCGRKSHRVQTVDGVLFTEQVEAIFNTHPAVLRAALVGVGSAPQQQAVVCIERRPATSAMGWVDLRTELQALAQREPRTRGIETFLRHPRFPVDIRHNAKIGREALSIWAARELNR